MQEKDERSVARIVRERGGHAQDVLVTNDAAGAEEAARKVRRVERDDVRVEPVEIIGDDLGEDRRRATRDVNALRIDRVAQRQKELRSMRSDDSGPASIVVAGQDDRRDKASVGVHHPRVQLEKVRDGARAIDGRAVVDVAGDREEIRSARLVARFAREGGHQRMKQPLLPIAIGEKMQIREVMDTRHGPCARVQASGVAPRVGNVLVTT